jgi:hypothetical protein
MSTSQDNVLLEWIDVAVDALRGRAKETSVVGWLIHHVPGMHQLDTPLGRHALQQECKRVMVERLDAYGQEMEPVQEQLENIIEGRAQMTVADVLAILRTGRGWKQ